MAKGGYRPGCGRPKGSKNKRTLVLDAAGLSALKTDPLDYVLSVQNDETQPADIRLRAAIAALPFCHPRLDRVTQSKKDEAAERSKSAAVGNFATPAAPKLVVNNQ